MKLKAEKKKKRKKELGEGGQLVDGVKPKKKKKKIILPDGTEKYGMYRSVSYGNKR